MEDSEQSPLRSQESRAHPMVFQAQGLEPALVPPQAAVVGRKSCVHPTEKSCVFSGTRVQSSASALSCYLHVVEFTLSALGSHGLAHPSLLPSSWALYHP